jgi:hypothetical protein
MSMPEAQAQFHYWCAARHCKAETRRLWRSRVMHAQTITVIGETPEWTLWTLVGLFRS